MRLVIVLEIPDEDRINPQVEDPHDVADAVLRVDFRGRPYLDDPFYGERYERVSAEWEDNATRMGLGRLLKAEAL